MGYPNRTSLSELIVQLKWLIELRKSGSSLFTANQDEILQALTNMTPIYAENVTTEDDDDQQQPVDRAYKALLSFDFPSLLLSLSSDECIQESADAFTGRKLDWNVANLASENISETLANAVVEFELVATTPCLITYYSVMQRNGDIVTQHYSRVITGGLEITLDPDKSTANPAANRTVQLSNVAIRLIEPDLLDEPDLIMDDNFVFEAGRLSRLSYPGGMAANITIHPASGRILAIEQL